MNVRNSYQYGKCPECGQDIPADAPEGWCCPNCGHAHYSIGYRGKQIRYVWKHEDGRGIYRTSEFKREDKIRLPSDLKNHTFVNIVERIDRGYGENAFHVKLYYADGMIFEGWTTDMLFPISILNEEELYDGRFNK